MTEVTLASLAMEVSVPTADAAIDKLTRLRKVASELEGQAGRTASATKEQASAHGYAGTAAAQAERTMRGLVEVYGTAFNAAGRYRHSVEAEVSMILQNAKATAALAREQDAAARAVQRLTSSYDPLGGEVLKVNRQLAEAEKLYQKGAISAAQYGAVADGLRGKIASLEAAQASGVKSSNALQFATLNLGRQFADVGVSLAGGINPLMVLIQQGPQIADGFAVAKQQGLGFSAVMKGMYATVAPVLPLLAGIAAIGGVVFGGAALAARALNQDNKNLAASLGLTEKQMDRLKDKGVDTGVTIGDVFKGTFNYIKGAVAPTLAPVIKWFGELFEGITKGAVITVKAIVGGFAGAFAGVKAIWSDLPAVMGDLFASGVNLAISAIEKLLNFATAGINKLIDKANAVSGKVGGPQIGTLGGFSLGRVDNPNAGAAGRTADGAAAAVADAYAKAGAGVDKVFAGIGAEITKAARDRIKKAAGDSEKTRAAREARDMSEERSAQIAAQLEQAMADELRARLSMAKEISVRADLERQIATATASAKQSRIDAQIAAIADDKGLSALKKSELTLELRRLKFIEGGIADIQRQAISEKERAELAAETSAKASAAAQNAIDLLQAETDLSRSATERRLISYRILDLEQAEERRKLVLAASSEASTQAERDIAQARLAILDKLHASQRATENDRLQAAYNEHLNAVRTVTDAFASRDWNGVVNGLVAAFANLKAALSRTGSTMDKIGAAAGVAAGIGSAVGGSAGAGIGGAASGAMAGAQLGSIVPGIGTAVGAVVGGILGGLGGLFGSSKSKKQAKAQAEAQRLAEEAARQEQIANTALQLRIDLLKLEGKTAEATALEQQSVLAKLDPSLHELQRQLWATQAATEAAAEAARLQAEAEAMAAKAKASQRSIILDLMAMDDAVLGTNAAVLAARQDELAALDPVSRALKEIYFARLDEGAAMAKQAAEAEAFAAASTKANELWAKSTADTANKVAEAAQRQADAMRSLGDSFVNAMKSAEDAEKSLRSFADSLLSELGLGSQQASYSATRSALQANAARGEFDQAMAQAFLETSKATQSSAIGYQSDVAWVRGLALNKADDLAGYPARLAMLFRSIQADSGLPGFANGGSMVIGGNPGVDQNVLSLNGAPVARVGYGETLSVTPAGGSANDNSLAAEVRALRADFAEMKAAIVQTAVSTSQTARQMMRWDGDGMPAERGY